MYLSFLFLAIIIMPISFIIRSVKGKWPPYAAITNGILWTSMGVAIIFVLSSLLGDSIGSQISASISDTAKILAENSSMTKAFNLTGTSVESRVAEIEKIYLTMAEALPASLIMLSATVCYIEYKIISNITFGKDPLAPKVYLREYQLTRTSIRGWILIFFIAWMLQLAGIKNGNMVMLNINILMEAVVAMQGVAFGCYFAHMKKVNDTLASIVLMLVFITGLGRSVLFILGIVDLFFNLRKRVA